MVYKSSQTKFLSSAYHLDLECEEQELRTALLMICPVSQSRNHMCNFVVEKYPVSSLDIQYSVFFLWETKKLLQSQLSLPVSTFCQLVNKSIGPASVTDKIVQCDRLESWLRRESSRIIAKYKSLKGPHRAAFKVKIINILIFKGELTLESTESPAAPTKLQISGTHTQTQAHTHTHTHRHTHMHTYKYSNI